MRVFMPVRRRSNYTIDETAVRRRQGSARERLFGLDIHTSGAIHPRRRHWPRQPIN